MALSWGMHGRPTGWGYSGSLCGSFYMGYRMTAQVIDVSQLTGEKRIHMRAIRMDNILFRAWEYFGSPLPIHPFPPASRVGMGFER